MNPEIDQSHNDPCVAVLFSCCVKRVHLNDSWPNHIRSMSISTSVLGGVGGGGGGGGNVSYESYAPHSSGQIADLNQMSRPCLLCSIVLFPSPSILFSSGSFCSRLRFSSSSRKSSTCCLLGLLCLIL